jgi:hypothetical protein
MARLVLWSHAGGQFQVIGLTNRCSEILTPDAPRRAAAQFRLWPIRRNLLHTRADTRRGAIPDYYY